MFTKVLRTGAKVRLSGEDIYSLYTVVAGGSFSVTDSVRLRPETEYLRCKWCERIGPDGCISALAGFVERTTTAPRSSVV